MKLSSRGRFVDQWNGNGWFVSFLFSWGWLLLAVRPWHWRLRMFWRLPNNHMVTRLYLGPFEIELTNVKRKLA
jgi:hypothetical protein